MGNKIRWQIEFVTYFGKVLCPYCNKETTLSGISLDWLNNPECTDRECFHCKQPIHIRNGLALTRKECSKLESEPNEIKWKRMDRDLKKGDIIRTKVRNKKHSKFREFCYSICSGSGFGCSMNTIGNAIIVDHQSFDLNEVLSNRDKESKQETSGRWERFWGIEYMEEDNQ
jgi:hypothetical protein